ncbi:MFS transporter [Oceanicola sp. 22II-s10i]|uniref:TCR/Tet family MFS transporter n=1 Tax=Oceanicola sp. 22II-s10i TaxID=1317116 RepID=UPI000B525F3E|nr:TCR/Tet family MFS transporter [Oceanicola sp. 22II-s10i]OWU85507.1 MFS transporter [Oceanicola sp. 22II-s10i]
MPHRLPLVFILATVTLDAIGIGLIFPVMPDLIREVMHTSLSGAAIWGGVLVSSFAAMQFLFGPLVGHLSDAFGRRPVLLISLAVMCVDYVIMALAGSIWLLIAGRILGGIASATHATASAFVADISRPEEKSARFGLVSAAFGVGFVIGPVIGGLLADFGTRAPFWAAAVLAAANLGFGLAVMPETVTDRIRRKFDLRRGNPLSALRAMRHLPGMGALLAVFTLYHVSTEVYPVIWAYFTQARFGWDTRLVGVSLTVYGAALVVVQALLIRPILNWLGDRRTVLAGFGWEAASLLLLAFVTSGPLAMVLTPITAIGGVTLPALQGELSRSVPDDAQGELQGVLSSLMALTMIGAPLVYTTTFRAFTAESAPAYMPGAPFLVSLGFVVLALVLFGLNRRAGATSAM